MYCSGCGLALAPGQVVCPQCGRPVAAPVPPIPGYELQLTSFSSQIRALSIVWFIYAGLSIALGIIGLAFANAILAGHFGQWMHGPWSNHWPGPEWLGAAFLRFAWIFLIARSALALAAGWGLYNHAPWGRVMAIIAAVFSILRFPLGTAMAIWTLVMLLGYRNTTLYEHLPQG